MGFAGGTVTLTRFFIAGTQHPDRMESLLDRLAARAITRDAVRSADGTEVGWVTGDHILDTDFAFRKNVVADGLHFAIRIDTHKPPADLVRSYQRQAEAAMLEAGGREFLSRPERREAREQAKAKADAEARAGAFRRMKQIPVFWDLKRQEVYLGSGASAVADPFHLLFRQTFDLAITPASSGELAARWAARTGETGAFDECRPASFVSPPDGAEHQAGLVARSETNAKDFLGTEWLAWLWYASHVESSEISAERGDGITVLFEKALQLDCAFKLTGTTSIHAEDPTRVAEAPTALASGKRPVRAGLQIAAHGDVFSFAVRGDAMRLSGGQLPSPEGERNPHAILEDRIEKLRDLTDAMDALYAAFLKRRLSPAKWPQTLSAMRTWIGSVRPTPALVDQVVG